jgi:hypothetical protein
MDFNRNPLPVPGDLPFSLDRLDDDVAAYLGKAGAGQSLPIERLAHMNPLAIELYRRYKIDIAREPLEFAVNNQHMNGGIAVDIWGQTNLAGCYAIGEAAGTHGVTRPGGAALNAGQVFGTRVAEHVAATLPRMRASQGGADVAEALRQCVAVLNPQSALTSDALKAEIQARMSDHAGPFCHAADVADAYIAARTLTARIHAEGIAYSRVAEEQRAQQWQQMALASEAVLAALDHYVRAGGGSRGARAICAEDGEAVPSAHQLDLAAFRFRMERPEHKQEQLTVRLAGTGMAVTRRPLRRFDPENRAFFERDWPDYLTGRIYGGVKERGTGA